MGPRLSCEDFRLVGAVAETGALPAAARRVGISHSTVFRRLGQVEKLLGLALFERGPAGLAPTAAGEEMARAAGSMAEDAAAFAARLKNREIAPAGDLRIVTSDALLMDPADPGAGGFPPRQPGGAAGGGPEQPVPQPRPRRRQRGASGHRQPSRIPRRPPRGDAGLALYACRAWAPRATGPPPPTTCRSFRRRRPPSSAPRRNPSTTASTPSWHRPGSSGAAPASATFRASWARRAPVSCASTSPDPAQSTGLWLLVHLELQRVPRARAVLDFAAARLTGMRRFLEGAAGPGDQAG